VKPETEASSPSPRDKTGQPDRQAWDDFRRLRTIETLNQPRSLSQSVLVSPGIYIGGAPLRMTEQLPHHAPSELCSLMCCLGGRSLAAW
jgi:hypothetical protein